jgi:hypothetical protein
MRRFVSPKTGRGKRVAGCHTGIFFYDDLQSYIFIGNDARLWAPERESARGQVVSRGAVSV